MLAQGDRVVGAAGTGGRDDGHVSGRNELGLDEPGRAQASFEPQAVELCACDLPDDIRGFEPGRDIRRRNEVVLGNWRAN